MRVLGAQLLKPLTTTKQMLNHSLLKKIRALVAPSLVETRGVLDIEVGRPDLPNVRTADGRNPFRTTLKPWDTVACCRGNQVIPVYLNGAKGISSIRYVFHPSLMLRASKRLAREPKGPAFGWLMERGAGENQWVELFLNLPPKPPSPSKSGRGSKNWP